DPFQAQLILKILNRYNAISGQCVNLQKSSVLFSKNTPQPLRDNICQILMGIQPQSSSKYLVLPLGIGKSKLDTFSYINQAVQGRLSKWQNTFLSLAGKEILLKA
ncbi:Unknown protein, partial [Striga hermonthica]